MRGDDPGNPAHGPLIHDPSQASADWVTAVLAAAGAAPPGARVCEVAPEPVGAGRLGTAVRLRLRWAGSAADLAGSRAGVPVSAPGQGPVPPSSVVAKFAAADPRARRTGWASGGYQNEVAFYRRLAGRSGITVPRCHLAALDPGAGTFVLMLEDLAHARQLSQTAGAAGADIAVALDRLAGLHATFWNGTGLEHESWLPVRTASRGRRLVAAYRLLWRGFLDRYGDRLSAAARGVVAAMHTAVVGWLRDDDPARTLVHGDFRTGNLLFTGGDVAVLDWQTVGVGTAAGDAAYLVGGSLSTEQRRRHEPDLFGRYFDALARRCRPVNHAALWRSYRLNALAGIHLTVVGAMLVAPEPDALEMFAVMAERHAQHAVDHDSLRVAQALM